MRGQSQPATGPALPVLRSISKKTASLVLLPALLVAGIRHNPGGKELPHDKYIHVVSEKDSPVQQTYIKTKDGLYVAAAIRKPKGNGPFPALVYFHGAPGGRGIEQITGWSRGDTGGPVWERFLQEGFVVAVADYRGGQNLGTWGKDPLATNQVTLADDGVAVVEYVKGLPYVNPDKVNVYGVSLGGDVTMHTITRTKVNAAILGAGAPVTFLNAIPQGTDSGRWLKATINEELARKNVAKVQCPVLILVGTIDGLLPINRKLHDLMEEAGKRVRMEVYENGYHDFCVGPQGHKNRKEPLLDATLDALEKSVEFLKSGR